MTIQTSNETTLEHFCEFLKVHLSSCEWDSGGGANLNFPEFDLMPQDYLQYAEEALSTPSEANRINCIGHLKRAIECECDTLMTVLNIEKKAKSLNFPKKLEFIDHLQLMPSRSMKELNRIRNKVEHEYSIPDVDDLTIYFDLIAGFVAAVEGALYMLSTSAQSEWFSEVEGTGNVGFSCEYNFNNSLIQFIYFSERESFLYKCDSNKWDEFQTALGVMFLLIRHQSLISADFVISQFAKLGITNQGSSFRLSVSSGD
jgi:hypothetical protein